MMNRRGFTRLLGVAVAGASVSGCVGSAPASGNAEQTAAPISAAEVEDRVRFTDLEWGSHCVPSPCMWSLQAVMENLSGESLVVGYVLTVRTEAGPTSYEGVASVPAWNQMEVVIRTEIPDTELQPTDFDLIAVKVEQPETPTPVPDPENYARIVDHRLEPDSILPEIHGSVENISEEQLSRVVIRGTFYAGDRAVEASNVLERDLRSGEKREFAIRYFRGNQAHLIDSHDVGVVEVFR